MTITTSAADFIRDLLRRLKVPHPVVCLGECMDTPRDIGEAVRREPHNKEVLAMVAKAFEVGLGTYTPSPTLALTSFGSLRLSRAFVLPLPSFTRLTSVML
jgi:hypothetical protein